jgi:asparagine synthase (glutamine-hydrolysing)
VCGIAGLIEPPGQPVDHDLVRSMIETLRHRGPDAQGIYTFQNVGLGHRRLSIIDVSESANQPLFNEDGSVAVVFNGEIYGYRDLRTDLKRMGCQFRTTSDTEVLLNAYIHWGDAFLEHIDGMYAAAIYDRRSQTLRLFRDRPGIKPLYYFWDGRRFAFASELKALVETFPEWTSKIDNTALYDFLTYRYIPTPKTLYRNIFKLPPASSLTLDVASMSLSGPSQYWSLETALTRPLDLEVAEAEEVIRDQISSSVEQQLVADVPVGFFLSGGLDSSVVVASAREKAQDARTFSIGFDVASHDETRFARDVAERFKTHHREERLSECMIAELLPQLQNWYDEPFADTSAFPTYFVSQIARESVKVALSGDGGDELFGGYNWYSSFLRLRPLVGRGPRFMARIAARYKWLCRPRSLGRKFLNACQVMGSDELVLYNILLGGLAGEEKARYQKHLEIPSDYDDLWYFRQFWRSDLPVRTRMQFLDFHTFLPDDILTKVDRVSMANGLEVRVPLLSRDLIELAFRLPENVRYANNELKGLIKRAYSRILPESVIHREKKGFSIPREYVDCGSRSIQEVILRDHYDISI